MKHIPVFFSLLVSLLLFSGCDISVQTNGGDESRHKIAEAHAKVWTEAIKQVNELIDHMPDDKLAFRPHDSMRTFAEQIVHIAVSSELITNMFLKDIPRPEEMPNINANEMDKATLKAFANEKLEKVRDIIVTMTDEQLLNESVHSYMGHEMTRLEGMMFASDHLTNHKAKANLYIRLAGHVPPSYRYY